MPVLLTTDQPFLNLTRMSKMLEQMQKGYYSFCPSETWTPNVNLYETGAEYLVCVDLAGVDKDKIDITVHDQRLTLRGHRVVPTPEDILAATAGEDHLVGVHPEGQPTRRVRVHVMEIDHGAFCREVELPHDVYQEQINARYLNGVLWIQLPKK
jgi:HSP20 family molecular chaperone IbpA